MADSNPPLGSPKSSGEAEVDGGAAPLRNTADSSAASAGAAPQKAGEGAATQGAPAVEGRADGVISRGTAKPASTVGAAGSPVAAVSTTRAERPKASLLNLLCTVFAIGSIFGALLLTLWLYKPMTKAWNNTRAPDHPSENVFDLGLGECVGPSSPPRARAFYLREPRVSLSLCRQSCVVKSPQHPSLAYGTLTSPPPHKFHTRNAHTHA
jgi:hypothetical protein